MQKFQFKYLYKTQYSNTVYYRVQMVGLLVMKRYII